MLPACVLALCMLADGRTVSHAQLIVLLHIQIYGICKSGDLTPAQPRSPCSCSPA